jgi:hypothetical protein
MFLRIGIGLAFFIQRDPVASPEITKVQNTWILPSKNGHGNRADASPAPNPVPHFFYQSTISSLAASRSIAIGIILALQTM